MIALHHRHQYLGSFIPMDDNLTGIMITAIDHALYSVSFSLGHNRNHTRRRIDSDDLLTVMGLLIRFPMIVFSFIPNMYNLCGHKNTLAWNGNVDQDKNTGKVLEEVGYELEVLTKLKGSVVMECGSFRDKQKGMEACVRSINRIPFKMGYRLVLMNSLDDHHPVATSLEDLHRIYQQIDTSIKHHIYVGIHLAYLFVNGLYDFRQVSEIQRLFRDMEHLFPKFIITLLYLSDTDTDFGSKQYRETAIGSGKLWVYADSLEEILGEANTRYMTVLTPQLPDMNVVREYSESLHS